MPVQKSLNCGKEKFFLWFSNMEDCQMKKVRNLQKLIPLLPLLFAGHTVYLSANYKHDPEKFFITGNGRFYIK